MRDFAPTRNAPLLLQQRRDHIGDTRRATRHSLL